MTVAARGPEIGPGRSREEKTRLAEREMWIETVGDRSRSMNETRHLWCYVGIDCRGGDPLGDRAKWVIWGFSHPGVFFRGHRRV
jgi:hypothetical protein